MTWVLFANLVVSGVTPSSKSNSAELPKNKRNLKWILSSKMRKQDMFIRAIQSKVPSFPIPGSHKCPQLDEFESRTCYTSSLTWSESKSCNVHQSQPSPKSPGPPSQTATNVHSLVSSSLSLICLFFLLHFLYAP